MKKKKKKKLKFRNLLLLIVLLYCGVAILNQHFMIKRVSSQINSEKKILSDVREQNYKLSDEFKITKTDKFLEKLSREKLGFIKEGETPVINVSSKSH